MNVMSWKQKVKDGRATRRKEAEPWSCCRAKPLVNHLSSSGEMTQLVHKVLSVQTWRPKVLPGRTLEKLGTREQWRASDLVTNQKQGGSRRGGSVGGGEEKLFLCKSHNLGSFSGTYVHVEGENGFHRVLP